MSRLDLRGVTFAYAAAPLFDDLTHVFTPGWTAVVGANGAGKSTLLRVLAGELAPDRGAVVARGIVVRVPQVLDVPPGLSPGEGRKRHLDAVLARAPDVLLLDEPEGHLDAAARADLVATLARHRGVGVIVAHDRALLDALCHTTLELTNGRARVFPGAYSAARAAWDDARAAVADARRALRAERDRVRQQIDVARRDTAAAAAMRSRGKRMRDKNDSDARTITATTRADWASRAHGQGVARGKTALARIDAALDTTRTERELDPRALAFVVRPSPQRHLMGGTFDVWGAPRDYWLARDARVHLAGDNGAGKTTLLRALLASATVPADALLVLPQELSRDETAAALAALRASPPAERGRTLQLVAALGARPEALIASTAPSPGEAKKLALALGLARGVSALVLDEPTNHLDLPSVERLQAALAAWPGALLVVTHDARLAAAVTTERWTLARRDLAEDGRGC